ncbi:hypothetical protein [Streptomyces sp. NPDC090445]|uniref:hypothetical protein n=1 Tax=Streptomyces sp. NPDC090445 TaxID=3365963 RepID=UPI0037FED343
MSGTSQTRHNPAQPDAVGNDRALAYPEPAPHPNWSTRLRRAPLTPTAQQHNQQLLLRALTGQAA